MSTRNQAYQDYAQVVLDSKLISEKVLTKWLARKANYKEDLAIQLINANLVTSSELTHRVSQMLKLPVASDIELEMFAAPHPQLGRDFCFDFFCVPLTNEIKDPFPLVVSNPFYMEVWNYLRQLLDVVDIKLYLAKPDDLQQELHACYGTQEEWEEYLVSQGKDPKKKTYPDYLNRIEEVVAPSDQDLATSNDPNQRYAHVVQIIPDWSQHVKQTEQKLKDFKALLD